MNLGQIIQYRKPDMWQRGYDAAVEKIGPSIEKLSQENDDLYKKNDDLCNEVNQLLEVKADLLQALFCLAHAHMNGRSTAHIAVELKIALKALEDHGRHGECY